MVTSKIGNYFESKVRRMGTLEDGSEAKVTELYVVRADSFTETESRVTGYVNGYYPGEFDILTEVRARYREIFLSDDQKDDIFYKVKVDFIVIDEHSGKEKKAKTDFLVKGHSVESAKKNVDEALSQSMTDYKIVSVGETAVQDIIDA